MVSLEIVKDGSVFEEIDVISGTVITNYIEQAHVNLRVKRNAWFNLVDDIDKINDEFYIVKNGQRVFGGRLINPTNEDDSVLLEIGSFEEDAINAEPTSPSFSIVDSDRNIILNAIDRIPELSAGTIEESEQNLNFIFSNTSPAGMIREVQRTTRSFVRYNEDKTIDFSPEPFSSDVPIVGPDERNVQNNFDVKEDEREEFTHVKVLGEQKGNAQITAVAEVPGTDTGLEAWKVYADKTITSNDRAQFIANEIIDEYVSAPRKINVETTVFGIDFSVGDRVRAVSDVDNIDDELFVISKNKSLIGQTDVANVILSNRLFTDESSSRKLRRDVDNYNTAFEGHIASINAGGFRQPVDRGFNYSFKVRKPEDIVSELSAVIQVEGLPFRTQSATAVSQGGAHSHTSDNPDGIHSHEAVAGIVEPREGPALSRQFPENVDLVINGEVVEENIGSGSFETIVDISGILDERFNLIELTTENPGHLRASVYLDVHRHITV